MFPQRVVRRITKAIRIDVLSQPLRDNCQNRIECLRRAVESRLVTWDLPRTAPFFTCFVRSAAGFSSPGGPGPD